VTAASGCGGGSRSGGGGCGGSGGGDGATMAAAMGNGDLGEGHQPDVGATSGVALASFFASRVVRARRSAAWGGRLQRGMRDAAPGD